MISPVKFDLKKPLLEERSIFLISSSRAVHALPDLAPDINQVAEVSKGRSLNLS
jgi:hypothetical protein